MHLFCIVFDFHYLCHQINIQNFCKFRRYRKLKGVMPPSEAEIEDNTIKQMSFNSFYLLLSTEQAKLAKLN